MENFKFTEGKWQVAKTGENKTAVFVGGSRICLVDEFPHEGSEHNANLIASAPELLENLIRLTERMIENDLGHMNSVERAQNAINKALGGTKEKIITI